MTLSLLLWEQIFVMEASSIWNEHEKKIIACYLSELPGSMKLHLYSAVQRRAAELKLQHEVHLQATKNGRVKTKKKRAAEVTHFTWRK